MIWDFVERLVKDIQNEPWAKRCEDGPFWEYLASSLQNVVLPVFLNETTDRVEKIIEIDPDLPEPEILTRVTHYMVMFLRALSASVRIYDPNTGQMLSYGSFPFEEAVRPTFIPLENTIAGDVVKTQQTHLVPNILKEDRYSDKDVVRRKGAHSLMAVPFAIPRFFPRERDTVGVIQIYYPENDREFPPLDIQMAEIMARRLSYVIARKKILALYRIKEKKEAIDRKIFQKIGSREGIKMKEVFNEVIPEIADIINLQSCALFSVSADQEQVVLEAGYPDTTGFHGIGKSFPVRDEPAFALILGRETPPEESPFEVITPSYVLIVDPQRSEKISPNLKRFAGNHNINSILYIPLGVGGEITHFMTFDALDFRQGYSEWEIEIFLFLGRELVQAQRLEQLDDTLHDFKNPAIATAGFARRLKTLLQQENALAENPTIRKYLDILVEETSRLQEMALSLQHVGQEQVVDLNEIVEKRFEINQEAIKEMLKANVRLKEEPGPGRLPVRCQPLYLERILDNLLNNATKAIPLQGGDLAVRTYAADNWACAEITNSGQIAEEDRLRLLEGGGRGRGFYITQRLVRLIKGQLEVKVGSNSTTMIVRVPLAA
ncbi:MAG: GAF domain-containing sensor histidine kinase [Deltaproteobacteria bacterium]|nr:GAF domain-containing sensor histidine kinase [Deltaproteobacteria bacterium]